MKIYCYLILLILFVLSEGLFKNDVNLECTGKKYENVTLTAYYPDYADEDHEQGYQDKRGRKLLTLQDYLDDRADYVTVAMDEKLGISYGSAICIPELNQHYGHRVRFEVRDSSSDLYGSGYARADICVRSEIDSYDTVVNRKVTVIFV